MKVGRTSLYKPVEPRLVKGTPSRPIYLGMHYRGFRDAEYVTTGRLPLNLIEVKPEYFKGKDKLFYLRGEKFHVQKRNFERLVKQAKRLGLVIQFHFPRPLEGETLEPGLPEDHDSIISLFEAMAKAIKDYELLPNLTFHLPTLQWKDKLPPRETVDIDEALENTSMLLSDLSLEHTSQNWPIVLGIENQALPTQKTHALGYSLEHFEAVMKNSASWINLTIDSGHRILSELSLKEDFLPFAARNGKRIINFHFHENQGQQTDTYHGDQHRLPLGDKIHGYLNYLRRAVQERIPIILEVDTKQYNPLQLLVVGTGIRTLLDRMEEERLVLESD